MRKSVLYIAASLDGFIAGKDGNVDWLDDVEGDGSDNGYLSFYETVDTLLMGRGTYEKVLELTDDFPYAGKKCFVLSRTMKGKTDQVTFTDEALPTVLEKAEGTVWIVGGGQVVQECLNHRLLDELFIAVIPKVLGGGIPLFPPGTEASLSLVDAEKIGDIVSIHYKRKD
ncbi:dihydrofolate reductase family protein [Domibacillus robiginosus]|uniref:dihydrofolate reductase family protein n=1 Tax=Domibacillus robiginosus TaxID=1071054 RepID=UPI00067CD52C|nr:dihydrofolate reductase family protein [Domibacillus robiginosus]